MFIKSTRKKGIFGEGINQKRALFYLSLRYAHKNIELSLLRNWERRFVSVGVIF